MDSMRLNRAQTTLAAPCTVSGRGYWTGAPNAVTFCPAPAGTGICFVRTDLDGHPMVAATAENRSSMPLRTRLFRGRAEVDMVEHVMAALYGLQIDNVFVQCTSAEMPAMDGSSFAFALALRQAGVLRLPTPRQTLVIDQEIRVGDDRQWIIARPHPQATSTCVGTAHTKATPASTSHAAARLVLEYQLDYGPDSPIGRATCRMQLEPQAFLENLAAARTFISVETARQLQSRGLARHVTEQDLLVFDELGPVNNKLRYADECGRHKLLDLVGDLALAGVDLVGEVLACRSGHQLNGQLAEKLRVLAQAECSPLPSFENYAA